MKLTRHLKDKIDSFFGSKTDKEIKEVLGKYVDVKQLKEVKETVCSEINDFTELQENWDGCQGIPLLKTSAENAILLLNRLDDKQFSKLYDYYPNPHGTISLEFANVGRTMSIEIGIDGSVYYILDESFTLKYRKQQTINEKSITNMISMISSL